MRDPLSFERLSIASFLAIMFVALCAGLILGPPEAQADKVIMRSNGGVGRSTFKLIRVYDDDDTDAADYSDLAFTGDNSAWITMSRSVAIFNASGGSVSFTVQAKGPDGNAYDVEDFNSDAALSISDDHCKNLTTATFPYDEIRLVVSGGATGLYVMGAD